jgi:hypothetical protein
MQDLAVIEVVLGTDVVEVEVDQPLAIVDITDLGSPITAIEVEIVDQDPHVTVEEDTPTVYIEVEPSEHVIDFEIVRPPVVAIDVQVEVMPGPEGPPGPTNSFAEGVQVLESNIWIMDYILDGKPAAFRFFDEFGAEIEPAEITYVNPSRSVAQWPEMISGSWIIS